MAYSAPLPVLLPDGDSPMHVAAYEDLVDVLEVLKKHGGNPRLRNKSVYAASIRAYRRGLIIF